MCVQASAKVGLCVCKWGCKKERPSRWASECGSGCGKYLGVGEKPQVLVPTWVTGAVIVSVKKDTVVHKRVPSHRGARRGESGGQLAAAWDQTWPGEIIRVAGS